jgi:hypothetical protein
MTALNLHCPLLMDLSQCRRMAKLESAVSGDAKFKRALLTSLLATLGDSIFNTVSQVEAQLNSAWTKYRNLTEKRLKPLPRELAINHDDFKLTLSNSKYDAF